MAEADVPHFEGHPNRECGEHRTVGSHRAWCHDCTEWCYPKIPCRGCELPQLRAEVESLRAVEQRAAILAGPDGTPAALRHNPSPWQAAVTARYILTGTERPDVRAEL